MKLFPKQAHFLFWLSAILIVGFFSTSFFSYLISVKSIRRSISDRELPLTGDNVYSEIQKDLVRPIFISSQMANNTFLRDWSIEGEKDRKLIVHYLQEVKKENGTLVAFFVSEKTRNYYNIDGIAQVVSEKDPRDSWFFRVRSMSEPYETNVDIDTSNRNTLTVFINYRVLDYQGKFIGVTGVGLALNNMKEMVETYEDRFDRRIYFVDRSGKIILANASIPVGSKSIRELSGIGEISDRILAGSTTPLSFEYNSSDPKLGNSTIQLNSRYIPELGWHLLVEQDESNAIKPLRTMLIINLTVSTIVSISILSLILPIVRSYQKKNEKIATTDPLTDSLNRQAFDFLFSEYLQKSQQNRSIFSAILFDIDHFKKINDSYGHLTGDRVIKQVASIVKKTVRHNDYLARWGGEEFILLLKDCPLDRAIIIAEKIRNAIEVYDFALDENNSRTTVSLGVAFHNCGESSESFFSRIDKALYRAKQNGRNRVES